MNGDDKKIYDRLGHVEIKCAEMHKDIQYIKENIERHNCWSKEKVLEVDRTIEDMNKRINWNENKIFLFLGATVVISTIVSLFAPIVIAAIF